jgi:hypothetical protein
MEWPCEMEMSNPELELELRRWLVEQDRPRKATA